ncbi:NUDIX hydrolase [Lactococcus fujiensis]|uniref:NUDIX hydrolase n=1 Tax=Lactococcus fujiensis TaxID=610251 RepID=UPI0006D2C6D1|nr:NUDIX domain-containing protein [Lactococcus fujiensis]
MSYISEIRKKIGHDLLIYLGAGVIVYQDNKILLQLRQDNQTWALHAGGIEIGEEIEETARRELFEETGLIAEQLDFFGFYSGKDRFMTYPNGDQIYMPNAFYLCSKFSGQLMPQEAEVNQLRWFSLDQLPQNIHQPNQRVISDFVNFTLQNKKEMI